MSSKSIKIKKVVAASLGACGLVGIGSLKVEAMLRKPVQAGLSLASRSLRELVEPKSKYTYHVDRFKKVGGKILPQQFRILDLEKAMDGHFGDRPTRIKPFKVDNSEKPLNISVLSHGDSEGMVHLYTEDLFGGKHRVYENSGGDMRPLLAPGDLEVLENEGIIFVKALDTLGRDVDVFIVNGDTVTSPHVAFEAYTGLYRDARPDKDGKFHLGHQLDPENLPITVKERFKNINEKIDDSVPPVLGPIIPSKLISYDGFPEEDK